jgi:flavin reductase (DIM6/NTAB) family NADH-FMN oxidoreductase RutF
MVIINKIKKAPSTTLFPVPVALVTSYREGNAPNIITIAWTGVLNSDPPVVYVSIQPVRHSHKLIKETGEFVINLPSVEQVEAVDHCGMITGREVNKFEAAGFTQAPASQVKVPLIAECPVNIECRVREVVSLGSHDVFMGDVLAVHYNENILDEKGRPDADKIKPYGYCLREYRVISEKIGFHGFSKKGG